jgi:hypothetical protein
MGLRLAQPFPEVRERTTGDATQSACCILGLVFFVDATGLKFRKPSAEFGQLGRRKLQDRLFDLFGCHRSSRCSCGTRRSPASSFESASARNAVDIWQSRNRNCNHCQIEQQQTNSDHFLPLCETYRILCCRSPWRYGFIRDHDVLHDRRTRTYGSFLLRAGGDIQAELHTETPRTDLVPHGHVPDCPLAEQRNGAYRNDEAKHHCRDQQRPKLGILSAFHHEDVIEILRLQL